MVSLGDNSYFQDLVDHTFEDGSIHLNKTIMLNSLWMDSELLSL